MLRHISQDCSWQCPVPVAGHYRPTPLQETLKHSEAGLILYPVGSLFLSPGSWCAQDLLCALQESLFPPVLRKSCNQIPLTFKVRFPGDSQFLGWIPRLRRLMCSLEPSQNCENFFGVIVLLFVSRPPRGYKIWFIIIVPVLLFFCVCGFSFVLGCGVSFFSGF